MHVLYSPQTELLVMICIGTVVKINREYIEKLYRCMKEKHFSFGIRQPTCIPRTPKCCPVVMFNVVTCTKLSFY